MSFSSIRFYKSKWVGPLIGALLVAIMGNLILLGNFSISSSLVHKSYDYSFHFRKQFTPKELIVIYLDDASYEELNPSYRRWDRSMHAQLLDRMTQEKAKAVIFDIIFSGADSANPEKDVEFAEGIEKNTNVILGADYVVGGSSQSMRQSEMLIPPFEPFELACATTGFVQVKSDTDFMVREHFHHGSLNPLITSMTLEAALWVGNEELENDPEKILDDSWINYYGGPLALPSVSYRQVIDPDELPSGYFRDKIVIIGQNVRTLENNERKDEFRNPYSSGWSINKSDLFMPGVEVHATILLNLIRNDWLKRIPTSWQIAFLTFIGLISGAVVTWAKPMRAVSLSILLSGIGFAFWIYVFKEYNYWFPWLILVLIQIPIALAWSITYNATQFYMQRQLLRQSLNHYLSPRLVKTFLSQANENFLRPGAQKKEVTILFSDIAGFTAASEGVNSDELAKSMNQYFQCMVEKGVHASDGTVIKYIGDAIFALWNAPEDQPDHCIRACGAALSMNMEKPRFANGTPVRTRIGLHCGEANVGNFGSDNRVDYTAIGENINLASRIEGLNKTLGTDILMSETVHKAIEHQPYHTRYLGRYQLSGFGKSIGIWQLVSQNEKWLAQPQHTRKLEEIRKCIGRGELELALDTIKAVPSNDPEDPILLFYQCYTEKLIAKGGQGEAHPYFEISSK